MTMHLRTRRSTHVLTMAVLLASCGGGGSSPSTPPPAPPASPDAVGEEVAEEITLPVGEDSTPMREETSSTNLVSDAVRSQVLDSIDSADVGYGPEARFDGWQCFNLGDSAIGRSTFFFSYSAADAVGATTARNLVGLPGVAEEGSVRFTLSVTDETTVLVDYAELSAQDEWTDLRASRSALSDTHTLSFNSLVFAGQITCSARVREPAVTVESDRLALLDALFVVGDKVGTLRRLLGTAYFFFGDTDMDLVLSLQAVTFTESELSLPDDPLSTDVRLSSASEHYARLSCLVVDDDRYEVVRCLGLKAGGGTDVFQFDLAAAVVRANGELFVDGRHVACTVAEFAVCARQLLDPETSTRARLRVVSE